MNEVYEDAINYLKYYGEKNHSKIEYIAYFLDCELKSYIKLQSNWNSLREWLEKQKENSKICKEWNSKNNFNDIDYDRDIKRFDFILDKMNELEGKDKK